MASFLKVKMLKQCVYSNERYPQSLKGSVVFFSLLKAKNTTGGTSDLDKNLAQSNENTWELPSLLQGKTLLQHWLALCRTKLGY